MNKIKEARKAAGLSQKYVALALGLKGPSVSNWESGKTQPTPENLKALANLFNVSVDYLLDRDDLPQEENADTKTEPIPEDEQFAEYIKLWPKMTKKDRAFILHMMRKMDEENQK